mgnify:CR=1 FL=1
MDKRKKYILMIDTETCNSFMTDDGLDLTQSLVYDIGVAIVDKSGRIYDTKSFVIYETFVGMSDVMQSAYYANKIPQYWDDIKKGKRRLVKWSAARWEIIKLMKTYNCKTMCAHNASFDSRALNNTQRYLTKSKFRFYFPYGYEWWDTLKMARQIYSKQKSYISFCKTHNFMTHHNFPQVRLTAEILHKYLSGDLTFEEFAKKTDKERKTINILVFEKEMEDKIDEVKSKEIICPKCGEKAIIKIDNYKFVIFGCKNKHKTENISFLNFEKTQVIDESKIICNNCKVNNKANVFEKKFYVCNKCKFNLCPICKLKHDKSHEIIDYSLKDYYCELHNEIYISYCSNCKMNICPTCGDSHDSDHDINNYKMANKEKKINQINEFEKKIKSLNKVKEQIFEQLNNFFEYMNKYYNICNDFINNYDFKNRNIEKIENMNNIINEDIISDIDLIINENISLSDKFNKIIEINDLIQYVNLKEDNNNKFNEKKSMKKNNNQIIKLIKNINMDNKVSSLCYLKKNNIIAMGKYKKVEFYNLNLDLINSYNSLDNLISYISELNNGKILIVQYNNVINILEFKGQNPQLYKKIETNESNNFVGIEISNSNIICGGSEYLSIIKESFWSKYSLEKTMDLKGFISNIIDLNEDCYLIGQAHNKRIIILSKQNDEEIYKINNIGLRPNNYSISKISNDFVGLAGTENEISCLFILSIKNRCICKKIFINELISFSTIANLNNDYFVITGIGIDLDHFSDLILYKNEIDSSGNLVVKQVFIFKRSHGDLIEAITSINNCAIVSDSSSKLKSWRIDI